MSIFKSKTFIYQKSKKFFSKAFWRGKTRRNYYDDITLKYDPAGNTEMDNDLRIFVNQYEPPLTTLQFEIKGVRFRTKDDLDQQEMMLAPGGILIIKDLTTLFPLFTLLKKHDKALLKLDFKVNDFAKTSTMQIQMLQNIIRYNRTRVKLEQLKKAPNESWHYAYYKIKAFAKYLYAISESVDHIGDFCKSVIRHILNSNESEDGMVIYAFKSILQFVSFMLFDQATFAAYLVAIVLDKLLVGISLILAPLTAFYDHYILKPILEKKLEIIDYQITNDEYYRRNSNFDIKTENAQLRRSSFSKVELTEPQVPPPSYTQAFINLEKKSEQGVYINVR